jgi:hypothetical protein
MAVLAGCSSLRLAYNNGDTLLYWWIDGYVDLNSDQKDWVRKDIDELFRWHRKTQLHDYVQILQTAQRQLPPARRRPAQRLRRHQAAHRAAAVQGSAGTGRPGALAAAGPDRHAGAQVRRQQCRVPQKEYARRPEAQQKFRYQKSMEQFELWFGNFTREQEAQIRKASDARPLDNEIWLDERQRRQKMILALVRKVQQENSARTPPWLLHADQGQLRAHGATPSARPSSTPPRKPMCSWC